MFHLMLNDWKFGIETNKIKKPNYELIIYVYHIKSLPLCAGHSLISLTSNQFNGKIFYEIDISNPALKINKSINGLHPAYQDDKFICKKFAINAENSMKLLEFIETVRKKNDPFEIGKNDCITFVNDCLSKCGINGLSSHFSENELNELGVGELFIEYMKNDRGGHLKINNL